MNIVEYEATLEYIRQSQNKQQTQFETGQRIWICISLEMHTSSQYAHGNIPNTLVVRKMQIKTTFQPIRTDIIIKNKRIRRIGEIRMPYIAGRNVK